MSLQLSLIWVELNAYFFPTFCSRSVPIGGLNITNARVLLQAWNNHNKVVNQACEDAKRCTVVKYEQLVLRPRETMTRLLGEFTCQRPPLLTIFCYLLAKSFILSITNAYCHILEVTYVLRVVFYYLNLVVGFCCYFPLELLYIYRAVHSGSFLRKPRGPAAVL